MAVKFCLDWNTKLQSSNKERRKPFDLNIADDKTLFNCLHFAASIPSVSMINDLTNNINTDL